MRSGSVFFGKTPPQPLPTRGRGKHAALTEFSMERRGRALPPPTGSTVKSLPLVGRGWGGV